MIICEIDNLTIPLKSCKYIFLFIKILWSIWQTYYTSMWVSTYNIRHIFDEFFFLYTLRRHVLNCAEFLYVMYMFYRLIIISIISVNNKYTLLCRCAATVYVILYCTWILLGIRPTCLLSKCIAGYGVPKKYRHWLFFWKGMNINIITL